MDSADFARWFRDATPYIGAHRGRTFVVLLHAEVLDCPNLGDLARDLALLHALGIKLVVVHDAKAPMHPSRGRAIKGCRHRGCGTGA